ncbi:type II toxin-antitoxin system VapC family toxin [Nonomuraea sp. NBC_01738]|uniref:type II toxin-antitoxin system VapC family toxin n=1 Tax=Nonomuraea sp. NBC_01738 TaxID=2976003 RepID=UPI003FA3AC2D
MIVIDTSAMINMLLRDDDRGRAARKAIARMWELRGDLTLYDASYVALAEAEDCPLLTGDARLTAAPGIRCEVRVV